MQKTTSFTGIKGINTQDIAMQEAWAPIVDRSQEHLGTSDRAIVMMRQHAARSDPRGRARREPPGLDPQSHRAVRPHDGFVPAGADWRAAFAKDWAARW